MTKQQLVQAPELPLSNSMIISAAKITHQTWSTKLLTNLVSQLSRMILSPKQGLKSSISLEGNINSSLMAPELGIKRSLDPKVVMTKCLLEKILGLSLRFRMLILKN